MAIAWRSAMEMSVKKIFERFEDVERFLFRGDTADGPELEELVVEFVITNAHATGRSTPGLSRAVAAARQQQRKGRKR